jgi:vancomycin resistance protein YoaR
MATSHHGKRKRLKTDRGHGTLPLRMKTPIDIDAPVDMDIPGRASRRRPNTLTVAAIAGVVALIGLTIVGLRLTRPGALPGTVLSGVEVGGLQPDELRIAVAKIAQERAAIRVITTRDTERVTARAADLGYRMDVDKTVAAVLSRGRQANPITAFVDHIRAFGNKISIKMVQSVDEQKLGGWATETARTLGQEPIEGSVRFEGVSVVRVDPQPGARVLVDPLREAVRAALFDGRTARAVLITAQTEPVEPRTTRHDVDALFAQATKAVSAPIRLFHRGATRTFTRAEIGKMLRVIPGEPGQPALKLFTDPAAVEEIFTPQQQAMFESRAVDARITLVGGAVVISESSPGFRLDPQQVAAQILALATGDGPREAELIGQVVEPKLTTEQARGLGIVQQVSSFTTTHACCQTRVTNIHRIADLVNGTVIRPGQTFSLNRLVGNRTPEKGFLPGKAIQDGEFVDQIGGGVSQFTTTMFNAAYFGGYDIVEHKPHSYYISRYPEGREATLNYPHVDLKIRNSSPYGVLVQAAYTDTSVTVSFWAKKWVTVESITGPRTNLREPETKYRENPSLPPGTEQVVQDSAPGFDVTVTRILRFPNGQERRQEFRTTYQPQPQIIERNSGS